METVGSLKAGESALRVLVVDDNLDAATSLGLLLHLWGHEVRLAHDGPSGLAAARAYRPNCLILDIGLPHLDGYDLARQVRQVPGLERAKLIAMTAYSDEAHVRRAKDAGFDFHLVKPADPNKLERILTMLNEVIRLASKTEELAQQNVALAGQTKELLKEVKQDIQEIKEEVKEVKEEVKELKAELREGRDAEGGSAAGP